VFIYGLTLRVSRGTIVLSISYYLSIYRFIDLSFYRFIDLSFYRFIVLSIYRFIDLSFYRFIVRFIMHLDCLFVDCNVLIMVGFWPCGIETSLAQNMQCRMLPLAMAPAGHESSQLSW